jgi:plastocyanin
MTDALRFDPVTLTVPRGTTITWRNTSQVMHTVTDDPSKALNPADTLLPAGAQAWDSGTIDPTRTFTHTFDVAGTYKYFCQPHEAAGMIGTIVVTP